MWFVKWVKSRVVFDSLWKIPCSSLGYSWILNGLLKLEKEPCYLLIFNSLYKFYKCLKCENTNKLKGHLKRTRWLFTARFSTALCDLYNQSVEIGPLCVFFAESVAAERKSVVVYSDVYSHYTHRAQFSRFLPRPANLFFQSQRFACGSTTDERHIYFWLIGQQLSHLFVVAEFSVKASISQLDDMRPF